MSFPLEKIVQAGALAGILVLGTSLFAATYSNIDQMSGWQSCSSCAGAGGTGPVAPFSMWQYVGSPSLDGRSAQFNLGGSHPYSNALWWKQLGANPGVSNFVYDLYYYIKNPTAPQALEFDVNQSLNGKKFIFGTECDFKWTHTWHVYNPASGQWIITSVPCSVPAAYSWNHVTLSSHRNSNGSMTFVSVTVNGHTYYFNRTFWPQNSNARELNVAFQMDGNSSQTNYSVWLDRVTLTAW
jgi:hypothetical protein